MPLKYFTAEWWEGGCDDEPFKRYLAYFSSIRTQLPGALIDLIDNYTLHDAKVKSIRNDLNNQTVEMTFHGWNQKLEFPVRYTLNFLGVRQFHQQLPKQEGAESGFGDLGYTELELFDDKVEMRMLFVSYAEFRLTFSDFSFEHSKL